MITIKDFDNQLRSYVGTPFHHGGRIPGFNGGLDCGGLMLVAMDALGMEITDSMAYPKGDGFKMLLKTLEIHCDKVEDRAWQPGDILLLRGDRMYHHLVYITEAWTIIHAWQTSGINRVVESSMLPGWELMVDSTWRIKGIESWQQ